MIAPAIAFAFLAELILVLAPPSQALTVFASLHVKDAGFNSGEQMPAGKAEWHRPALVTFERVHSAIGRFFWRRNNFRADRRHRQNGLLFCQDHDEARELKILFQQFPGQPLNGKNKLASKRAMNCFQNKGRPQMWLVPILDKLAALTS
jgi:hypothetical protein